MAESEVTVTEYGKNWVRLMRVRQEGDKYFITELRVNTRLQLSTSKDYLYGDNSDIVATDSQKNTVLVLAKQNQVRCPLIFSTRHWWVGLGCVTTPTLLTAYRLSLQSSLVCF